MFKNNRYGVIGTPIQHSLSPQIQMQFASHLGYQMDYQKYQVEPADLNAFISDFFSHGGKGLNVTLPHKQSVFKLVDEVSQDALLAGSVNTLSINSQGKLVGDTTDGQGLLLDLQRQNFPIAHKQLLVVGAGGASQSILVALLKAGASITLLNRTASKLEPLIQKLSHLGEITALNSTQSEAVELFDGVISTVSEFNPVLLAPIRQNIGDKTYCYDLNYAERASQFKCFALANRCKNFSDGLGMLIGQAAKSYQIWHGQLPDISKLNFEQLILNKAD